MTCEQALILISAALDGEVTEAERAALEEHLGTCPDCAALSEDFGVFSVALSGMNVDAPDDLTARIDAALDAEAAPAVSAPAKRSRHSRAWGSLAAMFAAVICLGSVFTHFNGGLPSRSASRDFAPMESAAAECAQEPAASAPAETEKALDKMDAAAQSTAEQAPDAAYRQNGAFSETPASAPSDTTQGAYGIIEPAFDGDAASNTTSVPAESVPVVTPAIETELSPMDGLMQIYELLGGVQAWPDAEFDHDARECVLCVEENDGTTVTTSIRYTGLSDNGWYYTYQLNTEENDGFTVHFSFANYFALKLDESELLTAFDGEWNSEEHDAFNAQING